MAGLTRFVRLAFVACALLGGIGASSKAPVAKGDQLTSSYAPEVRLRKLHLVRPDLIPYPIAYEVYC